MSHLGMGPGAEFDRIRAVTRALAGAARGLGDDCAEIGVDTGAVLVSTDASVEGVHFRRDWLTLQEIGWRATAAALSDLAAMGAEVSAVLIALVLPRAMTVDETAELMRGAGEAATYAHAPIVGGDMTSGEQLVLTVTVLGTAVAPIRRVGARVGDGVWVSGALGASRAALMSLLDGVPVHPAHRAAFAHPVPRLTTGQWLGRNGATAMIDLSDGLAGDARHLAAASGVRLALDAELVPRGDGVTDAAIAVTGGEDYELLVTLPASFTGLDAERCRADTGVPLSKIGEVVTGEGVDVRHDGALWQLGGFDHFGGTGASR